MNLRPTCLATPVRLRLALRVTLVCAVGLVSLASVQAADPIQSLVRTRVFLDPPQLSLAPGESRLVQVRLEGLVADELAAMQVELVYDPAKVELRDPNARFVPSGVPAFAPLGGSPLCATIRGQASCPDPEWMLTRSGRVAVGTARQDAASGRLIVAYGTRGDEPLVGGAGALALIEVVALQGGRVDLRLDRTLLADDADPPRALTHHSVAPGSGPTALPTRPGRR